MTLDTSGQFVILDTSGLFMILDNSVRFVVFDPSGRRGFDLQPFFGSVTAGAMHFRIICLQRTNQNTRNAILRAENLRTKNY